MVLLFLKRFHFWLVSVLGAPVDIHLISNISLTRDDLDHNKEEHNILRLHESEWEE